MKGKHSYWCPVCENSHTGFAMWRYHVRQKHSGIDPLYPKEVSEGLDTLDHTPDPEVESFPCTWEGCKRTFKTPTEFYKHAEMGHNTKPLTLPDDPTPLAEELAFEFMNYLKLHDDFKEQYPE